MRIILVRHAIAQDRGEAAAEGIAEADRPLTAEGREKMRRAARGLRRVLARPTLLASSPWRRARATADILAEALDIPDVVTTPALLPGRLQTELLAWLDEHGRPESVALVGHEPDLGLWAGWLLSGQAHGMVRLKKGSACRIDFTGRPLPGHGELQWLLTPRQLRELATPD